MALVTQAARHNLTEFVEVFLFLLCAMTFINTMQHLNVFARMRSWYGLADIALARHVIGCCLSQETREEKNACG